MHYKRLTHTPSTPFQGKGLIPKSFVENTPESTQANIDIAKQAMEITKTPERAKKAIQDVVSNAGTLGTQLTKPKKKVAGRGSKLPLSQLLKTY